MPFCRPVTARDCFVALSPPRNDNHCRHCEQSEAISTRFFKDNLAVDAAHAEVFDFEEFLDAVF
jgi:hypothetical protein